MTPGSQVDPAAVIACVIALVMGYAIGSIPLTRRIGIAAGHDPLLEGERAVGTAAVWALAGPGWGFLALTAEIAKGVVPVSLGVVTVSWVAGWAAGLGAVLGACWPAFGRLRGDPGVATLGGAAFALAPPAGAVSALLGLAVAGAGRLGGRNATSAPVVTGFAAFPALFLALHQDLGRLVAVAVLYLVALVRLATATRR